MKKVIFVAGTAYSGSTFFHMMLANDPHGLACGEIRSLLSPRKPNHRHISCSCGRQPCPNWQAVKNRGQKKWFDVLWQQHPEVETVVVSSKSPIWIEQQNRVLEERGIPYKNILIWKTPAEYGQSMKRRGFFQEWEKSYVNYFRLYATLIDEWRAVRYENLVKDDEAILEVACHYLNIPYFSGKARFWERAQHVLAGNSSARFHLYENKKAESVVQNYDQERMNFYRKFYYRPADDPEVLTDVARAFAENPKLTPLLDLLKEIDVQNGRPNAERVAKVRMSSTDVALRKIKDYYRTQIGKVRYKG